MQENNFWNGKKVLVTGHTGFKGCWLTLWLIRLGAKVTGVSLEPDNEKSLFEGLNLREKLEMHNTIDIRNIEKMRDAVRTCQPDIVFHLAAQALVRVGYREPLETWSINVDGSLILLEMLKELNHKCAVVMVTTDKVYENYEWIQAYRETDRVGGHDPYSASKAAAEIAIESWRKSFCGEGRNQTPYLRISTARSGNVIGGGDWSHERIVPDAIMALKENKIIGIRNPEATRPWQHVLDPLNGYMKLAKEMLVNDNMPTGAFNFGPAIESNRKVSELVETILMHWEGEWKKIKDSDAPHEAKLLHLQIDKAYHVLKWRPNWGFEKTIERTVNWYKSLENGEDPYNLATSDLNEYERTRK